MDDDVVARLLIDKIIARPGVPRTLLSDGGKTFLSSIVMETCRLLDITKLNTTAYHPQTDGLVERFNGTLAQSLSTYVSKTKKTGIATFLWFYSRIEFLRRTSPVNRHFSFYMVAILDCP